MILGAGKTSHYLAKMLVEAGTSVKIVISLEPFGFETNLSAVAACFNNVGPGFALVGPTGNFSIFSDFSKFVLSIAMLLGRLEIFPLVLALSFSTWKKQ